MTKSLRRRESGEFRPRGRTFEETEVYGGAKTLLKIMRQEMLGAVGKDAKGEKTHRPLREHLDRFRKKNSQTPSREELVGREKGGTSRIKGAQRKEGGQGVGGITKGVTE